MGLMRAPKAPVIDRKQYGRVEYGFMRDCCGFVFFLAPHGRETISFPVLEDGKVSPHGDFGTFPETVVDLVHPKDIGITELRWADR